MKAAVLSLPRDVSKRPLEIREVPKPQLKPGHVLLRVRACGVCRTDLHIVEGELPPRCNEIIPGHQIVGEIVDPARAILGQALALASRGLAAWMEAAGFASTGWRTFVILQLLPAIA